MTSQQRFEEKTFQASGFKKIADATDLIYTKKLQTKTNQKKSRRRLHYYKGKKSTKMIFNSQRLCPKHKSIQGLKEILVQLKSHVDLHTLRVVQFNTLILQMARSFRQKVSGKILQLTDVINKINLTDIYRTSLPSTKEYTFFSAPHETFSKIDHMLGQKTSLSRYK